jgi:hypothetical protein
MRRTRLSLVLLGLLTASCTDSVSVEDRMAEAFRGPLTFYVVEDFATPAPGPPIIKLWVMSVADTACGILEGDYEFGDHALTVRAVRVTDPGCPLPTAGIWRGRMIVTLPWSEGRYTLRFEAAGVTTEYYLVIERDRLWVEPASALAAVGVQVVTPELTSTGRLPERWMFLTCFDAGREECAALEARLMREHGVERVPFPEGRALGNNESYLRYRDEADFPRILATVCDAVVTQPGRMISNVGNWLGVFRQAWRMENGAVSCHGSYPPTPPYW